jgi:hypothetical protein
MLLCIIHVNEAKGGEMYKGKIVPVLNELSTTP